MKVLFICGALEKGKDGVGDYTRRLAGELIRQGHHATIIAYNDRHIVSEINSEQEDEGTTISVLRLPSILKAKEKVPLARDYVQRFQPDWISLQFVIYSFHPKGLPFFLSKQLRQIGQGYQWHIMFHELWIGEYQDDQIKDKLIGFIQQKIIESVYNLGKIINVTGELNQKLLLFRTGSNSLILPICSNINVQSKISIPESLTETIRDKNWYINRPDYFIIVNFGNYYYSSWDIKNVIPRLEHMAKSNHKKLVLLSIGNLREDAKLNWDELSSISNNISVARLGVLKEEAIAEILLRYTDLGIVTTPLEIIYKSGTYQVFKELGIPVLAKRNHRKYRLKVDASSLEEVAYLYNEDSDLIIERAVSKSNWNSAMMCQRFTETLLSN